MADEKTTTESPWNRENPVEIEDIHADERKQPQDASESEEGDDRALPCGANRAEHDMSRRVARICETLCRSDEDAKNLKAGICILAGGVLGESSDEDEKHYRHILDKHFEEHREDRDKPESDFAERLLEMLAGLGKKN